MEVLFNLSEQVIKADLTADSSQTTASASDATNITTIPTEHIFAISDIQHQTLAIFSQDENNKLAIEGQVVQKGECRPIGNEIYMRLKKETIKMASQPTKVVQKIDRAINNFKPINVQVTQF